MRLWGPGRPLQLASSELPDSESEGNAVPSEDVARGKVFPGCGQHVGGGVGGTQEGLAGAWVGHTSSLLLLLPPSQGWQCHTWHTCITSGRSPYAASRMPTLLLPPPRPRPPRPPPRRGVLDEESSPSSSSFLLLAVASFHPLGAQKMPAALSILIFLDPGATPAPVGSAVGRAPFGKRAGALLLLLPRLVASPPPE